jgi:hypothetical protein
MVNALARRKFRGGSRGANFLWTYLSTSRLNDSPENTIEGRKLLTLWDNYSPL